MRFSIKYLVVAACLLCVLSCRKNKAFNPSWDMKVAGPIFKSSLTINNIVGDSMVGVNPDSSLQLIFHNTVYSFDPNSEAIEIPNTNVVTEYQIGTLKLANDSVRYPFSLGEFCKNLGLVGLAIIAKNGQEMALPPVENQVSDNLPLDVTQFFEKATIKSGNIFITIENGFPIDISNLVFELRNEGNGELVANVEFDNIPAGKTDNRVVDLAGKDVEGHMLGRIIDLDSPGSNGIPVKIDTSAKIVANLKISDIKVAKATARFPSQNIIDQDEETVYDLDGGAKLKKIRVKTGSLVLKIHSSISQNTHFDYQLPSASDGTTQGISFSQSLPAATNGNPSTVEKTIDLAGYDIDLTGNDGTKFNTFVNHLKVSLESPPNVPIELSTDDGVSVEYGLVDIVPDYVSGYLGQQIVEIGPEESALDVFKRIKGGTISIEDVKVDFNIENGLGADGRINIYKLQSINSSKGQSVDLVAPSIIGQPLAVTRGTDNPRVSSNSNYNITTGNSNIKSWIENLPDKIAYRMDVFMNPYGNSNNYGDFAYSDTRINVNLDMQMPLSLIASRLTLEDTIDFSLGSSDVLERVKAGTFHLICDNKLPLAAEVRLILLDADGNYLTDLVVEGSKVEPAPLDANCKVLTQKRTVFDIPVDEARMQKIKGANLAIVRAVFDTNSTSTCNSYLKIYSNYSLDCKLTGNFTYFTGD